MPRGVFVRTSAHRESARTAWFASEKSRARIDSLCAASQTPAAQAKRNASVKTSHSRADVRRKISLALTGRAVSEETKQKIRKSLTRLTPEQKAAKKRINRVFSNQLSRILRKMKLRKGATAEVILGYTREQLRDHLEKQFRPGMSWAHGGFHVDHKAPIAEFLRAGIMDPAQVHALSNLQILTPAENLAKGDRTDWLGLPV